MRGKRSPSDGRLLFFLEEKNGQFAREAQPLRRTDAGTSCVVVGRNTAAGMPPSSALSLPVSAAPARQLSRANRPRKRKSSAEQLPPCAPAVFANVLHKTDGSYVNRPFFLFRAGHAGKHLFTDKSTAPQCLLFLFFKKRNRSPSFLFRRKKRSACTGSAGPQTDGRRHILRCRRSEYHSGYASLLRLVFARVRRACASAFPCKPTTQKKIICGTVTSLRSCRFRQRAAQNGRFKCEPSVFPFQAGRAGKRLFAD